MAKGEITPIEACEQFEKVCDMIGQPWADGEYCAKPGDWFIKVVSHFYSIYEKTESGKKPVVDLPVRERAALNMWDFYRSMHTLEAFLARDRENHTASVKPPTQG